MLVFSIVLSLALVGLVILILRQQRDINMMAKFILEQQGMLDNLIKTAEMHNEVLVVAGDQFARQNDYLVKLGAVVAGLREGKILEMPQEIDKDSMN
jgi:hypothetical protein